jgi:ferrochelatase
MSFGSPETVADVPAYYTRIRGGQKPSEEAIAELEERYRRIGGRSPLLATTRQQARLLETRLTAGGLPARVYVGMRFWHPLIAETVRQMAADGVGHAVAIALAPHFNSASVDGYIRAVKDACAALPEAPAFTFVERWGQHPLFVRAVAEKINASLAEFPNPDQVDVIFTAHSVPARVLAVEDPYPDELAASAAAIAAAAGLARWELAYQSAGAHGGRWLGPDILEKLAARAGEGRRAFLLVPFGFLTTHLEILHDLDYEAQQLATELGLTLRRTALLDTDPLLIETLADLARERLAMPA